MSNFSRPLQIPPLDVLEWLRGSPTDDLTHDVQLLLLIQVNCPGCFIHAIPAANELASSKQSFDVYCISTAFEDFEYNTMENTRLLLEDDGSLVGAAKQRLGPKTEHIPQMPLAYDIVKDKSDLVGTEFLEFALEASKENTREQMKGQMHPGVLEKMLHQANTDLLLPEKIARVFWNVRGLGTPFWVLHRRSGEVLDRKIGQHTADDLLRWIQPFLLVD